MTVCALALTSMMIIGVPPAKYDCHFEGTLAVVLADAVSVHELCNGSPADRYRIYACAMPLTEDRCVIVLPKVEAGLVTQAQQNRYRRHEEGHCNGWGADHSGAVYTYRRWTWRLNQK